MNICIFGDSIAWGVDDPENGGWVNLLRNYCAQYTGEDICIYNQAICGDTTETLLKRFWAEASSRSPGIIIFAIGINDVNLFALSSDSGKAAEIFRNNLQKLLMQARKFTNRIIFAGLTDVDEKVTRLDPENLYYTEGNRVILDQEIAGLCKAEKIKYLPLSGVLQKSDLTDGLHPGPAGHRKIFAKVKPEIENIIAAGWE